MLKRRVKDRRPSNDHDPDLEADRRAGAWLRSRIWILDALSGHPDQDALQALREGALPDECGNLGLSFMCHLGVESRNREALCEELMRLIVEAEAVIEHMDRMGESDDLDGQDFD